MGAGISNSAMPTGVGIPKLRGSGNSSAGLVVSSPLGEGNGENGISTVSGKLPGISTKRRAACLVTGTLASADRPPCVVVDIVQVGGGGVDKEGGDVG